MAKIVVLLGAKQTVSWVLFYLLTLSLLASQIERLLQAVKSNKSKHFCQHYAGLKCTAHSQTDLEVIGLFILHREEKLSSVLWRQDEDRFCLHIQIQSFLSHHNSVIMFNTAQHLSEWHKVKGTRGDVALNLDHLCCLTSSSCS